jgi:methanethiol oxidase
MSGRLGLGGQGDGMDKLVTVNVKPGSPTYGKVIDRVSVDGRNEAHHGGFTDDRRQLWLAGLENSKVFIFDVHTDPSKPRYVKTIDNFPRPLVRHGTARRLCLARTRA